MALRIVAHDAISGLSAGGGWEEGDSSIRESTVKDDTLIQEATRQAARLFVQEMRAMVPPVGSLLFSTDAVALVNRGTSAGYRKGTSIVLTRGRQTIGTGRIEGTEPDQSAFLFDGMASDLRPGDRVRVVSAPSPLPPHGRSAFDGGCAGLVSPRRHRRDGRSR